LLDKNQALADFFDTHSRVLAQAENMDPGYMAQAINAGRMVLLANPNHKGVRPTLIGQPARIKVNANIGTSPFLNDPEAEAVKLRAAVDAGADTVMDLSTAGDLDRIRTMMIRSCDLPLGTVPIYSVAQKYISRQKDPAEMSPSELMDEIRKQAEQGVDFVTVHCGVTRRAVRLARESDRVLGIVSRGGSLLARWMEVNDKENPLLTGYDELLEIAREHNVTLSLGDGLRPGAGADAGDGAQWEEVVTLGELARRAVAAGVQAMIEGPGHVPLNQVEAQIKGIKAATNYAPLYVLGPLVTDSSPGYDHVAGAIGGAVAAMHGVDFLCYLTPAEHLTLPGADDVRQGVIASRIAAQAGEVALGRPWAVERDRQISVARRELDWRKMSCLALDPGMVNHRRKDFEDKEECAMCGEFCAVKMFSR